jgi:hypothetical protein
MGDAERAAFGRIKGRSGSDNALANPDFAFLNRRDTRKNIEQVRLPIPGDAGEPEYFA